jgi:hypothetical protein
MYFNYAPSAPPPARLGPSPLPPKMTAPGPTVAPAMQSGALEGAYAAAAAAYPCEAGSKAAQRHRAFGCSRHGCGAAPACTVRPAPADCVALGPTEAGSSLDRLLVLPRKSGRLEEDVRLGRGAGSSTSVQLLCSVRPSWTMSCHSHHEVRTARARPECPKGPSCCQPACVMCAHCFMCTNVRERHMLSICGTGRSRFGTPGLPKSSELRKLHRRRPVAKPLTLRPRRPRCGAAGAALPPTAMPSHLLPCTCG